MEVLVTKTDGSVVVLPRYSNGCGLRSLANEIVSLGKQMPKTLLELNERLILIN